MSYFKKIVDRTLDVDREVLKPAITPISIPQHFENNSQASILARRITASSKGESAKKKLDDGKSRPVSVAKPVSKEEGGEKDRQSDQLVGTVVAAEPASTSLAEPAAEPAKQGKADSLDQSMMSSNDQVESEVQIEKDKKSDHYLAFVAAAAAPVVLNHAATEVGTIGPKNHPKLRPATGVNERNFEAITQPDETTVTINIGRIEVRAIGPPTESRPLLRKEYSPPVSLDEYLKHRMEGRKR